MTKNGLVRIWCLGFGIPELSAYPQGCNGHETFLVLHDQQLTTRSNQGETCPAEEKLELLKELKKLEEEEAKGTKMLFLS